MGMLHLALRTSEAELTWASYFRKKFLVLTTNMLLMFVVNSLVQVRKSQQYVAVLITLDVHLYCSKTNTI